MVRKLLVFLTACMLVVIPMASHAMGFGNIKMKSALNEPLDAEIDLLSATVDEVSGLTVKLASREAFLRAGIDRPNFLNDLKFEIKSRTDDTFYILINTRRPVREPFLNFLLELNWYNGRILREYTVLLDPPGRIQRQPVVVEAPELTKPAVIARPDDEPLVEPEPFIEPEPVVAEQAPEEVAPAEVAVEPIPEEKAEQLALAEPEPVEPEPVPQAEVMPMEEAQMAEESKLPEPEVAVEDAPIQAEPQAEVEMESMAAAQVELTPMPLAVESVAQAEDVFLDDGELFPRIPLTEYGEDMATGEEVEFAEGALDYGITRNNDNLWTIAQKLRPDESVSIYQVMMALLKSNPDAFVNGNVHRLKVGHVLRIEDPSLLSAMSEADAASEYRLQTAEWDGYRQEVAAAAMAEQPIMAGEIEAAEVTPEEATGELTVAAPSGEELTAGEGLSEAGIANDVVTLQEELRRLRADAAASGGQDAALNSKIMQLEDELAAMQRAISIQDTELAALQQQLAERPAEEQMAPTPAETEALAVGEEAMPSEAAPMAEEQPFAEAETPAAEPQEPAVVQEQAETMQMAQAPEAAAIEQAGEAQMQMEQAQPMPAPVPQPQPAQQPMPTAQQSAGFMAAVTGVIGAIAGNSMLLYIGLPALLVLILLMMIVVRRRKQTQSSFQESILTGGPAETVAAEAEAVKDEESSFLSDFAVSGAGAIHAEDTEVDPLTEADVFMAYGRYEAAEERLNEAIANDPSRKELKLKLLELYNATKNQSSFESAAEDFYAGLGENASTDPMWEKVLVMGKELAPSNPLFSGAVVEPGAISAVPEAPVAEEEPSVGLSDSQVMDIGLETGVFQADDLAPSAEEASTDLDFNLDLGEAAEVEAPAETSAEAEIESPQAEEADMGLDFNLDLGESAAAEEEAVSSEEPPTSELEVPEEAAALDFNLDLGEEPEAETAESALDFNLDMGESSVEATETDETLETEAGGLDFSMDELAKDEATATLETDTGGMDFSLDMHDEADEKTMAINFDEGMAAAEEVSGEDDTAMDLDIEAATELPEELDPTMAIDLDDSMDFESIASEPGEAAAELSMDMAESADAADLDLGVGGDEVGTKLDLAKAYIDMGDPEGARSILDEVIDEGNESQKQEAQQLMQQIA